jgi:DNA polymerase (family 10)
LNSVHRLLGQLAAIAAVRGDRRKATALSSAAALVHAHDILSRTDLDALIATVDRSLDSTVDPADSSPASPDRYPAADPNTSPPAGAPDTDALLDALRAVRDAEASTLLASAMADLPADLRSLVHSGALTVEQLLMLHEHLGVTTAADLTAAVRQRTIHTVPGLDASVETAVARALPRLRVNATRIPLGRAIAITEPLLATLRGRADILWAEPVGSLRRGQDTVGDLEVVAPAADPQPLFDALAATAERQLHRGSRRLYVSIEGVQVGIRSPAPESAAATLLDLTGSRVHLERLGELAAGQGWRLEADGLHRADGSTFIAASEAEIYAALGLPFIAPEIREGHDELDAAENGTLPELVERRDIRGDLHMHTDWSDGHDSIEDMVRTSAALGYEYIALTDHTEHSAASRNLTRDDVARQAEAIEAVRQKYPGIVVLHGCEVDILADGSLDLPDTFLQRFDIVLASLHNRGSDGRRELMNRYARAMRHPLVTIITHPTNRVVPRRAGYELDWDRVIGDAVETGTVLEVDGAPSHLDMPGELARRAIGLGAMISIDSDCHRADLLERQMGMGLLTARRGWVEARHVINTRPIEAIRAIVSAKRSR